MSLASTQAPPAPSRHDDRAQYTWWRSRPVAAWCVRATIFLAPIAVSIATTYVLARAWHRPPGTWPGVGWWIVLVAVGGAAMWATDRVARRFLPLSLLLRMTLVFPDAKPSRFGVALRSGTTRQLQRRIEDLTEHGLVGTERTAAEQLLELAAALRVHDRFTRGHGERVRAYAALIGEELGLDEVDRSKLQWAGLIHDVGKLAVPDEILNKAGRLTDDEFDVIKTHPAEGMRIAGPLAPWLGEWLLAVGEHHERWDGTGYPNRLAGSQISLAGRIVAVADVFDVITAARSYKPPQSPHHAREELARHAGSQFDPDVVRAFLNISIGRLRTVMWPLSWLANVPYLGSSVTAPATSWIAPALVAVSSAVTGGAVAEQRTPPEPPAVEQTTAPAPTPPTTAVMTVGSSIPGDDPDATVPAVLPPPTGAPAASTSSTSTTSTTTPTTTTSIVAGAGAPLPVLPAPEMALLTTTTTTITTTTTTTLPVPMLSTLPPSTSAPSTSSPGAGAPATTPAATTATTVAPAGTPAPATTTGTTTATTTATTTTTTTTHPTVTTTAPLAPCDRLRSGATALSGADLRDCVLAGLDLNGVDLSFTNLAGADMRNVRLGNFSLEGANLSDADLTGATVRDGTFGGVLATSLNARNATFERVDFGGADLTDADLESTTITDSSFGGADLTDATLANAVTSGVNFNGATLDGADLRGAVLDGAELLGTSAVDGEFDDASLRNARLDGADLTGASLRRAVLRFAVVGGTDLTESDVAGADFTGASGRPLSVSGTEFSLTTRCPTGLPAILPCWP